MATTPRWLNDKSGDDSACFSPPSTLNCFRLHYNNFDIFSVFSSPLATLQHSLKLRLPLPSPKIPIPNRRNNSTWISTAVYLKAVMLYVILLLDLMFFFSTVHHSIDLFHLPTLMHNSFIY